MDCFIWGGRLGKRVIMAREQALTLCVSKGVLGKQKWKDK